MMLACSSSSSSTTRGTTHLWEIVTLVVSFWDNTKAVAKLAKASASILLPWYMLQCDGLKICKQLLRTFAIGDEVFFLDDILFQDLVDN